MRATVQFDIRADNQWTADVVAELVEHALSLSPHLCGASGRVQVSVDPEPELRTYQLFCRRPGSNFRIQL